MAHQQKKLILPDESQAQNPGISTIQTSHNKTLLSPDEFWKKNPDIIQVQTFKLTHAPKSILASLKPIKVEKNRQQVGLSNSGLQGLF
jgi:hypothetical protein